MDDQFDVDKFISLVQSKESIWNYKSKIYSNKLQRIDDWISICENMVEDFKDKSSGDRNIIVREYQAKWKVLRDGFTRSIKNYKKKGGSGTMRISRGKLYTYYTQLEFLNDLYGNKSIILSDDGPFYRRERKVRKRQYTTETSSDDLVNENISEVKKSKNNDNVANNTNESGSDEDKQFLLSLLSDFRKIHEDRKLDAKGDIINVLRHYRNASNPFHTRDSYYINDIAALATTATDRPDSRDSSYEYNEETSRDNSPTEIKFITS